jgi:hypothetical protein
MATAALKRRQLLLFSSRGVAANRFQFRLGNEESQRGDPIQEDDKGISALTVYAYPRNESQTGNVKLLTIPLHLFMSDGDEIRPGIFADWCSKR